jgi:arginyl-tRNA synthetase
VKQLTKEITRLVVQALENAQAAGDLPSFEIPSIKIETPKHEDQGDYSYPAMQLSKLGKKNPRMIAEDIVKHLPEVDYLAKVEVIGPGFINFFVSDDYLKQAVEAIIAEGESLFMLDIGKGKIAQVEYVSANPSGPITIGHSRGAVLGDTMARLLAAAGYDIQREYYFNNAGEQMIKLGQSLRARYLQELGEEAEIPTGGYQGQYMIDVAKQLLEEKGDSMKGDSWETFKDYAEAKMFEWIKKSLNSVDIHHDAFFNEDSLFQNNAVWEVLDSLKEKGYIYTAKEWKGASEEEQAKVADKDPAHFFESTQFGDDKDRILVKSNGVPTYTLPDIAYHRDKLTRNFDVAVNVLGSDHYTEAQVVRRGIEALGLDPTPIHVIFVQMVRAVRTDPETGEKIEVKQSKRAGNFDTLDELVEMTSADAVRYHMLARSPNSQLDFDVDEVVKQSNDNPVYYIQNAHVRCWGIFREAEERGFSDEGADMSLLGEDELKFIRKALELGDVIATTVDTYEPHRIAFFAHEVASTFHPIYDKVRVLHTEVPEDVAKARLRFYKAAQVVFQRLLHLMGMSTPERM